MPPKRPAPLSDAAITKPGSVLGETNAGVPYGVKNTFIDVPSGLTPESSAGKKLSPLKTAPAQVGEGPGFIQRMVASSLSPPPEEAPPAAGTLAEGASPALERSPPRTGVPAAVQRPGLAAPGFGDWPLMTPSPTGNSMFASTRYQLFGGPAPVQEAATHSALSTAPAQGVVATTGTAMGPAVSSAAPGALRPAMPEGAKPLPSVEQEDTDDDSDDSQVGPGKCPDDAPKPPPGAKHPSMGSENHEEGTCKRCCFFPRNRCQNGYNCEFCHYEHEKRKRKNKKSKKKNKDGASGDAAAADGTVPAPEGGEAAAPGGLMSTAGMDGASAATDAAALEAHMWHQAQMAEQLYPQSAPGMPQVQYERVEGIPQWTYQWIDAPRVFPVPSAAEATSSYFAAATGLQATAPGMEQAPHMPQLGTPPPAHSAQSSPYLPGNMAYSNGETMPGQQWPTSPAMPGFSYESPGAGNQMSADAMSWAPPCAPPAYEPNGVRPPTQAPCFEPTIPHQIVKAGEAAPPRGSPMLHMTIDTQPGAADPTPPPPVSSPKLPSDLLMSLPQDPPPPGALPAS